MATKAATRTKGDVHVRNGERTAQLIRDRAAELFYEHGYEATSLREIANAVGIQVGSLYNHMSGKEELLTDLMVSVLKDLLAAMQESLNGLTEPRERLKAGVECHIRFHAQHRRDTFIGNTELRALSPDGLKRVTALRKEYEESIENLIREAAASSDVDVLDLKLQTYSVLAQGAHVATWFNPKRGQLDHVVDTYTTFVFRAIGIDPV